MYNFSLYARIRRLRNVFPMQKDPAQGVYSSRRKAFYAHNAFIMPACPFLQIDIADTVLDPDLRPIGLAELLEIP